MARGWESKAIESQQEDAARLKSVGPALTPDQRAGAERRRSLELTRARLVADLARASVAPHRATLESAIRDVESQLAELA